MTKETVRAVHQCECQNCQQAGDHPDKELHHQMNLLFSRLDEQQQRWYVALEAKNIGHGGMTLLSQITGRVWIPFDVGASEAGQLQFWPQAKTAAYKDRASQDLASFGQESKY